MNNKSFLEFYFKFDKIILFNEFELLFLLKLNSFFFF